MAVWTYSANVEPKSGTGIVQFVRDSGVTAQIELGKAYELTDGEVGRLRQWVIFTAGGTPGQVTPLDKPRRVYLKDSEPRGIDDGDLWFKTDSGLIIEFWLKTPTGFVEVLDLASIGGGGGSTDPEVVRDTIAAALVAGTNVAIVHNDAANTITISASGSTDPEVVRDTIGSALVAGTGVTITVNDAADTITISSSGAVGSAGGDLSGSYPNPQIASGAIVNADVNASAAIAESKLSLASDGADGVATRRTLGPGAQQAAKGNHTHPVTDLTATGTRDATTFLRGDNTWAVPSGGGAPAALPTLRQVGRTGRALRYTNSLGGQDWTSVTYSNYDLIILHSVSDTSRLGLIKAASPSTIVLAYVDLIFAGTPGTDAVLINVSTARTNDWLATATVSRTGNTTDGSNNVTSVSSMTGVVVGAKVSGAGIPAGTTIATVGGSSFTMSANATATATGVTLTIVRELENPYYSPGTSNQRLLDMGKPGVKEALAEAMITQLATNSSWDGLFLDDVNPAYAEGWTVVPSIDGYTTTTMWGTAIKHVLQHCKARIPTKLLIGNIGQWVDVPTVGDEIAMALDGAELELFAQDFGRGVQTQTKINNQAASAKKLTEAKKIFIGVAQNTHATTDTQTVRYGLAFMHAIAEPGYWVMASHTQGNYGSPEPSITELGRDNGQPLGLGSSSSGLWTRTTRFWTIQANTTGAPLSGVPALTGVFTAR